MKRQVWGEGPSDAKILLVGEALGEDEERLGRPFVGKSGHLLDQYLTKSGIIRAHCYVTNVIKERPHNNEINRFIDLSKKVPRVTDEAQQYIEYLQNEIASIRPSIVVAFGNVALWALTGKTGVTKWRGSILESTLVPGVKVIPVLHPAAALRQYLWRHLIHMDLTRVAQQSATPDLPQDRREYIIRPTFEECVQYLQEARKYEAVAFDIEVTGAQEVSCISFAISANSAISIPFTSKSKHYFSPDQEAYIWNLIGEILEDETIEKIAHNGMFDSSFLFAKYGIRTHSLHDTMVAVRLIWPSGGEGRVLVTGERKQGFPASLAFVTSIYTLLPYYKDDGKEAWKEGAKVEEDSFWLYNAKDSIVLMEAFPKMRRELEILGDWETYDNQRLLIEPLLFISSRGIQMDVNRMQNESRKAEMELVALESKLNEIVGYEINPRSPLQLKEYFYERKKEKPYYKKGAVSVDEKALKRLAAKGYEEARILLKIRKRGKEKSTYLDMGLDADSRLRCSMNPSGTYTGRLSSSKTIWGTGANMQNQPRSMKKYMMLDEGYVGYEVDLSQAENRVVAYLGPDVRMIDAFENGIDIHSRTAGLIFGLDEKEVKRLDKMFEDTKDHQYACNEIGGGAYSHRYWGKKANHALNYDLGARTFALYYEITEREAQLIVDKYHTAYPGVRMYHRKIQEALRESLTLENLLGRRIRFMDRWGDDLFKEGYAFVPQSSVADKLNRHGVHLLYHGFWDNETNFSGLMEPVELLNQIHDSLIFQVPINIGWEQHAEILNTLRSSLERTLNHNGREFVIPADAKLLIKNFANTKEISKGMITADNLEELYG